MRLCLGTLPEVVEKRNGIFYPMEKRKINRGLLQAPRKGGYTNRRENITKEMS